MFGASGQKTDLLGRKFLLGKFIEYPIIAQLGTTLSGLGSAAQPAETMRNLLNSYEEHKKTAAYKKRGGDLKTKERG